MSSKMIPVVTIIPSPSTESHLNPQTEDMDMVILLSPHPPHSWTKDMMLLLMPHPPLKQHTKDMVLLLIITPPTPPPPYPCTKDVQEPFLQQVTRWGRQNMVPRLTPPPLFPKLRVKKMMSLPTSSPLSPHLWTKVPVTHPAPHQSLHFHLQNKNRVSLLT